MLVQPVQTIYFLFFLTQTELYATILTVAEEQKYVFACKSSVRSATSLPCRALFLEVDKMQTGIKAIETQYKGYRFRSRLEARWAVFFDELGIEWEYESEGYELSNGERYLPDFYFPNLFKPKEVHHNAGFEEHIKKLEYDPQFINKYKNACLAARSARFEFDERK